MVLHIPQLIFLAILCASLTRAIMRHGEPENGKVNALATGIAVALTLLLLHWGGFFRP